MFWVPFFGLGSHGIQHHTMGFNTGGICLELFSKHPRVANPGLVKVPRVVRKNLEFQGTGEPRKKNKTSYFLLNPGC